MFALIRYNTVILFGNLCKAMVIITLFSEQPTSFHLFLFRLVLYNNKQCFVGHLTVN